MRCLNVLLVDDDSIVLKVQGSLVSRMGHVVTTFDCPLDALDYLSMHKNAVDLVLSDFRMPKMNGMEFTREVRQLRNDMPIAILTGFSGEIDPDEAEELNIEVFSKPISLPDLTKFIEDSQAGSS